MISAIVLVRDEQRNIKDCINCLKFCSEILVIDDNSKDKTKEIATKAGAKVYSFENHKDFSRARNFGLTKAKNEWILFLDADERISKKSGESILSAISEIQTDGFWLLRRDYWLGYKMGTEKGFTGKFGDNGSTWILRLAKKDKGVWKKRIHETWEIGGVTQKLNGVEIEHFPHPTVYEFVKSVNYYSKEHAVEIAHKGGSFWKIIYYPCAKFFYIYILGRGFKDGLHGFVFAGMMSLHSFLAWTRSWLITTKRKNFI